MNLGSYDIERAVRMVKNTCSWGFPQKIELIEGGGKYSLGGIKIFEI